jgi:hypothetical protein
MFRFILCVCCCAFLAISVEGKKNRQKPVICALKPDPPPLIDGSLNEWNQVPGEIEVTPEQVCSGKTKWKTEDDLSGSFRICWDRNYLYITAQVVDDKHKVTLTGAKLWQSDHIEFDIDVDWDWKAKGEFKGKQYIFGFSPGNFSNTGDPMADLEAEFYVFKPDGIADNAQIDVASRKTEDGYTLEARIPWSLFKIKPTVGMILGIDMHFSDTDDSDSQESFTALRKGKWGKRLRQKLIPMILTDAEGKSEK